MAFFAKILDKTIWVSYLALVIVTPLLFSTQNSELFEVPKMLFVYLGATIILFTTVLKFIITKKLFITYNLSLITLSTFVLIQLISTFFSIDKFTSIFGYPSRLNGGLLSQFAYLALFGYALINLNYQKAKKLLMAIVIGAFAVSLWGIPSHFGFDPSCYVMTQKLTSSCWQKDSNPEDRIFATLGQPNWLASYLVLVLPLSLAFVITQKSLQHKVFFGIFSLAMLLALMLTQSRSGLIGLVIALVIFVLGMHTKLVKSNLKLLIPLAVIFIVTALFFGGRTIVRVGEFLGKNPTGPGTESGQIRLIVWEGAIDVFKRWPILGSGPETFAYSYYLYRPFAHNTITEWNFFYNKAHNELLNYLANIGIVGTIAFLLFVGTSLKEMFTVARKQTAQQTSIVAHAAIAAILGYLISIFFGFSVVVTQLIFFLLIAAILVMGNKVTFKEIQLKLPPIPHKLALVATTIIGIWAVSQVGRMYFADLFITRAKSGNASLIAYDNAIATFPTSHPFYLADYSQASATLVANSEDSREQKILASQAETLANKALTISPNNPIIARRIANSYIFLANYNQDKYGQATENLGAKLVNLSPTDPQSYFTKAKIEVTLGKKEEAKKTLEEALRLKPNYIEAKDLLEQVHTTIDN